MHVIVFLFLCHVTNNMLKTTYQYTIKEKERQFDTLIDAELEKIIAPK